MLIQVISVLNVNGNAILVKMVQIYAHHVLLHFTFIFQMQLVFYHVQKEPTPITAPVLIVPKNVQIVSILLIA